MLLLRRGRGRFPVSYLRIGGIRPHSTGGPLSGFAAKQTELENLRRAVTAARSAVTRSQAKAARLANDEETARVQHLTKRLAAEEGGIEVVKQQLVLDVGLARATAAAIELVDLASTLTLPRSVDDSRLLDDEPPLVVPKAPAAPAAVSAAQPWLETVGSAPADVTPADAPRSVAELEAEPVAAEELVGFAMGFWDASHTHRDAAGKMKNQEFKIWEREHPEIVMSAQHSAAGNSRYNSMLSAARAKVEPVAEPAEAQNTEASNDTGVGLGQWLTQFREQKQTEAEQAAEEAAAEEAAHHARQAALAASPPVPVQHFETWRVMPDLYLLTPRKKYATQCIVFPLLFCHVVTCIPWSRYSATKASDVLEVWAVEGEEFGWCNHTRNQSTPQQQLDSRGVFTGVPLCVLSHCD